MTSHVLLLAWIGVALCTRNAGADGSIFAHEPGLALSAGGSVGINSDDMATDYDGSHPIAAMQLAYRLHVGLEGFATAGLGLGGHEAIFSTWGIGLRQRLGLGRFEPFIEGGVYEVGDDAALPLAVGVGAGIDVSLDDRWFAGANVGHFFSNDSDGTGGLDWSAGAHLGVRLGAGYPRARD